MTDESQGWHSPEGAHPPMVATAPAGWYPDPWSGGQHRYWDGSAWTGGSFPHGPADPWAAEGTDAAEVVTAPPVAPPAWVDPSPPPPPDWSPPSPHPTWSSQPPTDGWGSATTTFETPTKASRLPTGVGFVALVLGIMIVVGSLGTLGGYLAFRHQSHPTPTASGVPPTVVPTVPGPTPTVPRDPAASVLASLVITQADVPSTVLVQPYPLIGGDQVAGIPTLDLCNGTFPSESLRTARLQITAYDGIAAPLISTEAVLYGTPAATEQAFSELKSVAAKCPTTPVVSPVGDPTAITRFNASPDGAWSSNTAVTRQAFDYVTTDEVGTTSHAVAVYLRRGRVLVGVYFYHPDSPQVTVSGQTTIEKIAAVFADRMASLPASVVNG